MSDLRQRLGRWGESLAARYLSAAGFEVIDRNFRCSVGEMDLVAQAPDGLLVFVEVKTRRGDAFGRPEDAITTVKANRLIQIAETYLQANQLAEIDWRIDVIAIELDDRGRLLRINQIENAVTGW